jgi:hypothetical protein
MGYTHYWTFSKPALKKGNMDKTETVYKKALIECQKIARVYNDKCLDLGRSENRLSGFSAHTKIGKYGGLEINGKGDLSHETFSMREHYRQNFEGDAFNFCKTARKPYDLVVTACLALLKYRLGDLIEVSSDGDANDWTDGVSFAREITGLKILNPIDPIVDAPKVKAPKIPKTSTVIWHEMNGKTYIEQKSLTNILKQAKKLGPKLDFNNLITMLENVGA